MQGQGATTNGRPSQRQDGLLRSGRAACRTGLLAGLLTATVSAVASAASAPAAIAAPAALPAALPLPIVAEPDQQPFLMLDIGMHTGLIYRVSADRSGELLATGSTDKSIRLWNLKTGRAVRKIHLPLGEGTRGEVTAVALSPSGAYLVASTTAFDTRDEFEQGDLHVIRVADGKTLGRLSGFRATFSHLQFAPDSSTFAAIQGAWGVQIWAADGRSLFHDHDINDPYVWLAYAPDGRLTAVTRSGQLRRYARAEGDKILLEQVGQLPKGLDPYSIAYSPDGLFLAIGYADGPRVDIVDGDSFEPVASHSLAPKPAAKPAGKPSKPLGNLGAVAWSQEADGSPWLFAGGTYQDGTEHNLLVAWPYGHGAPRTLPVSEDSITHLQPVAGGGVVFASTEPSWGRVSVATAKSHVLVPGVGQGAQGHDFRKSAVAGLVLSADATRVWVKPRKAARPEVGFDLRQLALANGVAPDDGHRPSDARGGTKVVDWYDSLRPRINGQTLKAAGGAVAMFERERSLSVDVSVDGKSVLLGTDYFLRLFDKGGREQARHRLSTPAWAVALAPRGDVAVAALGDGTVRWYALTKGLELEELAAAFLHVDRRRWAAWSADGRFAHSDYGGASMVGYEFNGTRKQLTGQWVSFASLYRVMYKPEVVASLLDDPSRWPALVARDPMNSLPGGLQRPDVDVVSFCTAPEQLVAVRTRALMSSTTDDDTVQEAECWDVDAAAKGLSGGEGGALGHALPENSNAVELRMRVTSGTLETIDTFVNGRNQGRLSARDAVAPLAGTEAAASLAASPATQPAAPPADGELAMTVPVYPGENVIAIRAYGPAGVYREIGPIYLTVPVPPEERKERVLRILAVGVDAYQGSIRPLEYAVKDATSVADTLRRLNEKSALYTRVADPVVLANAQATREGVLSAITALAAEAGPDDAVVVYLAGHGLTERERYIYVSSDVQSIDAAFDQGVTQEDLVGALARIVSRNVFLFLDTCYSGTFRLEQPDAVAHETGRFVLTAAKSTQQALDRARDADNGVFAYAIVQGLEGKAALVSAEEVGALGLGAYVRGSVRKLAQITDNRSNQDAVFKAAGGGDGIAEFPLVPVGASAAARK